MIMSCSLPLFIVFNYVRWGVTVAFIQLAIRISKEGPFVVLVLDLYRGEQTRGDKIIASRLHGLVAQDWNVRIMFIMLIISDMR